MIRKFGGFDIPNSCKLIMEFIGDRYLCISSGKELLFWDMTKNDTPASETISGMTAILNVKSSSNCAHLAVLSAAGLAIYAV